MSDEVIRQAAELRAQKEDTKTAHIVGQQLLGQVTQERDDSRKEANRLYEAGNGLIIQLNVAMADVERLTAERDAAMVEVRSQVAANRRIAVERDAAEDQKEFHRDNFRKLQAECEGLRADALAYPPSYHQELAIERKRHLELIEDYNLQATMIETLQEGLKRTESLLAKAQGQDIDPRLKGFLATISQLADQSQDMIP